MTRALKSRTNEKMFKARRDSAMGRPELRIPSEPRAPTAGPTSFPVKADDPAVRQMIDEAMARRQK